MPFVKYANDRPVAVVRLGPVDTRLDELAGDVARLVEVPEEETAQELADRLAALDSAEAAYAADLAAALAQFGGERVEYVAAGQEPQIVRERTPASQEEIDKRARLAELGAKIAGAHASLPEIGEYLTLLHGLTPAGG